MDSIIKYKKNNFGAYKEIIGISVLAIICAIIAGQYAIYLSIPILLITLTVLFGEKLLLATVIISLFTLVGDFNKELRPFIQIIDFGILSFLFFKRFGIQFDLFPRVPKVVLYFIGTYYVSMIISLVFSNYPLAGAGIIFRQTVFFAMVYIF